MYKQIIIVRKDLNMSPGKLAEQVARASSAFLLEAIKRYSLMKIPNEYRSFEYYLSNHGETKTRQMRYKNRDMDRLAREAFNKGEEKFYTVPDPETGGVKYGDPEVYYDVKYSVGRGVYEDWVCGDQMKVILEAENCENLLNAVEIARDLGMKLDRNFFLIYDDCYADLGPEEDGKCLTCIGFHPMDSEVVDMISRKYKLYEQ